jgi:hypothetical protein
MDALPDAVKDFIHKARVCHSATVRATGEPHAIPVCPAFDGEATVYVDIGSSVRSSRRTARWVGSPE